MLDLIVEREGLVTSSLSLSLSLPPLSLASLPLPTQDKRAGPERDARNVTNWLVGHTLYPPTLNPHPQTLDAGQTCWT